MINKIKSAFHKKGLSEEFVLTFTKKWVSRLMWFSILGISVTYALAVLSSVLGIGAEVISSIVDLSKYIIRMIIGVMLAYMVKAFWETYADEKNKLSSVKNDDSSTICDEDKQVEDDDEESNISTEIESED